MTKRNTITLIILILIFLGIGIFWWMTMATRDIPSSQKPKDFIATIQWRGKTVPLSEFTTPSVDTALAQLQQDMKNITPHFVVNRVKNSLSANYTQQEKIIRDDLVVFYAARYEKKNGDAHGSWLTTAYNGVQLNAVGKRYLLVTEAQKFAFYEVLDTKTGNVNTITDKKAYPVYLAPKREIALYIEPNALYTYSLNQASSTLVAGSKLEGNETYDSGFYDGPGVILTPEESHSFSTITISIFNSSKLVSNPNHPNSERYKKVGEKKLTF